MPQGTSPIGRTVFRLLVFKAANEALDAVERGCRRLTFRAWDEWDEPRIAEPAANERQDAEPSVQTRTSPRRVATALVFSVLFFAGAALSAGAGDQFRGLLERGDSVAASTDASPTTTDGSAVSTPAPAPAPDAAFSAPADGSAAAPADPAPPSSDASGSQPADPAQATSGDGSSSAPSGESDSLSGHSNASSAPPAAPSGSDSHAQSGSAAGNARHVVRKHVRAKHVAAKPKKAPPLDPEVKDAASATVWLNQPLPDPTPPALRLTPRFARELATTSSHAGTDWALVLAVLRARGALGSVPASPLGLRGVVARVAGAGKAKDAWGTALRFSGQMSFADRATALAHYYRAVGLNALVSGLEAAKPELTQRVLSDSRLSIYPGGRDDLAAGRVDVRVITVMEYLADTFGQVSVSCLVSGHRLYARPGVISAHIYGRAVDVSALGGTPIAGHQQLGSVTEQAVRSLLLLPQGMQPAQVISLIGLGGPSFPLADHWNHIHIGY